MEIPDAERAASHQGLLPPRMWKPRRGRAAEAMPWAGRGVTPLVKGLPAALHLAEVSFPVLRAVEGGLRIAGTVVLPGKAR